MSTPEIFYLVPDYDRPSWGVGLLYGHVRLLRSLGFRASVLHQRAPFQLSWMNSGDLPIQYLDAAAFQPRPEDFLVVPEVLAAEARELPLRCRRAIIFQGSYHILSGVGDAASLGELGFEFALTILPHVREALATHFRIQAEIVPPFVAPYFFAAGEAADAGARRRRILLHVKGEYRAAGIPDHDILTALWRRRGESRWQLEDLGGLSHRQVAETMAQSAFFINLNCMEAFNTTVPEAMATGCIPICYEAYGGQDFLADGENAFVFPNNYVFPLAERVFDLVDRYERVQDELRRMRAAARQTALRYTEERTRDALERVFRSRCH